MSPKPCRSYSPLQKNYTQESRGLVPVPQSPGCILMGFKSIQLGAEAQTHTEEPSDSESPTRGVVVECGITSLHGSPSHPSLSNNPTPLLNVLHRTKSRNAEIPYDSSRDQYINLLYQPRKRHQLTLPLRVRRRGPPKQSTDSYGKIKDSKPYLSRRDMQHSTSCQNAS